MWPCGILKRVVYGVPERTATSAPGADLTLEWRDAETAPDPGPGGAHDDARESRESTGCRETATVLRGTDWWSWDCTRGS